MLTSRFTSTLRRARRREPVERLTVTIAGSSCGVRPIAIASENSSASMNGRCSTRLITKIDAVSTPATRTRRKENWRSPTWNAVSPGARRARPRCARSRSACRCARRRRVAEPSRTMVPISAHERSPFATESARLLDRERTPREHSLVALELGRLEQADVGRNDVAERELQDVAGDEIGDVDALRGPRHERRAPCGGSGSAAPRPPARNGTR